MQLAARPPAGVGGREVSLLVNHFSLGLRINSSLNVYSISLTALHHDTHTADSNGSTSQQQQQQGKALPRGLVQHVLQELSIQAGWPAGWVLVGPDRLASSGSLCEEGSEVAGTSAKSFTVKLLSSSLEEPAAAAAAGGGGSTAPLLEDVGGSTGGTFKVRGDVEGS
jgi:hypothetical protein